MIRENRATAPAWIWRWLASSGRRIRVLSDIDCPGPSGPADLALAMPRHSSFGPPQGLVTVALRSLPDEQAVLDTAAEAATYIGAALAVRHAVPLCFAARSVGLDDAVDHGHLLLAAAHDQLATAHVALPVVTELRRVRPYELVGEAVDADLLVLGGTRPGFGHRLGLVARSAAQHAPCPVLLVGRPAIGAPAPERSPFVADHRRRLGEGAGEGQRPREYAR